ncbi:bifunctional metallophosphatase/5'-nucleotidase [Companilactobacillus metriopterae]|uniref:bifunctional metallophosphatase/5'-nucleotidase n=1 Tax=Companilactobacillus metriopterae TaxID=1909267 RepID=UPI00100B96B6|nr:bifunctional metallophosphatase/5'-nucleotidase [Companilactobacillus metriopterae]
MEKIQIVHTNDLHSHYENFPRIKRYINDSRKESKADDFLLFDIGDSMDRAHPLTEATNGHSNIEWMNQFNYDAVTIGNNEGLGNSHEELSHLYDDANFPVLVGNLFDERTHKLAKFSKPYKIIETTKGTRIGVIGLTAPYILTYPLIDWDIRMIRDTLNLILDDLAGKTDVIILLSHLGISMDRSLAKEYDQLDLILGSHTHHLFEKGELDEGTLLCAAGKYGQNIGNADLVIDDNHQIVSKKAWTVKTSELSVKKDDDKWVKDQFEKGEQLLDLKKVAKLPKNLSTDVNSKNRIIDIALDALQENTGAEVAVLSTGLFLEDLPKGIISEKNLHDCMPHAIHAMKTVLSGRDVWRLVMEMEKNRPILRNHHQRGMGFRGIIFGELVYKGITVDEKRNVYINGKALEENKMYTLGLLDHYLFIPYFPTIEIVGDNEIMYPNFIRTVIGNYLKVKYPIEV